MEIIEYESTSVQLATAEVLSNSCSDQDCRKRVASRCSAFLTAASKHENAKLKTIASGALIKLMFADKELEARMVADDNLARSFIVTLRGGSGEVDGICNSNIDHQSKLHAVEALAYLSLRGVVKELVAGDALLLKQLVSFAKTDDRALQYGLVSIFGNISAYRRKLSEEEEQLMKLKEAAGEGTVKLDPMDNDARVEKRASKLVSAGVVNALCIVASAVTTPGLAEATAQVFVNLAVDKRNRGRMVQDGAVKALVKLTTTSPQPPTAATEIKGPNMLLPAAISAAHALAKIAITTDPNIVMCAVY